MVEWQFRCITLPFKALLDKKKMHLRLSNNGENLLVFISKFFNFIFNLIFPLYTRRRFKGSDRLCKLVELEMQCCGKLLSESFETY